MKSACDGNTKQTTIISPLHRIQSFHSFSSTTTFHRTRRANTWIILSFALLNFHSITVYSCCYYYLLIKMRKGTIFRSTGFGCCCCLMMILSSFSVISSRMPLLTHIPQNFYFFHLQFTLTWVFCAASIPFKILHYISSWKTSARSTITYTYNTLYMYLYAYSYIYAMQ